MALWATYGANFWKRSKGLSTSENEKVWEEIAQQLARFFRWDFVMVIGGTWMWVKST